MDRGFRRSRCRIARRIAIFLGWLLPAAGLARGGWEDPPGGFEYVYEADAGQDRYVAGDNVAGLLDGTWLQSADRSDWDGTPPGVANTTQTDPSTGDLLPPAPGGAEVICPVGARGENGTDPLCYLQIEDVGNPADAAVFSPPYAEPSKRRIYFYHPVGGTSENGWTLVARLRLAPQADVRDPKMTIPAAGYNGDGSTDFPMVAVHDTGEGTVGFSIDDQGKLVVLDDDFEVDIGPDPTRWLTVWLSAIERPGAAGNGRYDIKVFIDGSPDPALTLTDAPAPRSEIAGSPDSWIAIGSGHSANDAAFQVDYLAYKPGAWEPGKTILCPQGLTCGVNRAIGRSSVSIDWTIPAGADYDGIDVGRDGAVLASGLAGTSTTYLDIAPLPGAHRYEVTARQGAETCSSTCPELMCLHDLDCSFHPAVDPGKVRCALTWMNPGGLDGIQIVRRLQHAGDVGETDEVIEPALAGNATGYEDPGIPSADLTRITYTLTATSGTSSCQVQCRPTACPHGATCAMDRTGQPMVHLTWAVDRPFAAITVGRRSDPSQPFVPKETLAGSPPATEYLDPDVVELGYYEYEIIAVQGPGEVSESCPAARCGIRVLPAELPYEPPAGGWDYIYDAEAAGSDAYSATAGTPGNLDGHWIRSTIEDFWDGSRPGDTGPAPGGPAPGGIAVVNLPAADPCKHADRHVLLIEDTGDPRLFGYPDPSNRKLFLGLDLGNPGRNLLHDGVTFSCRMRLRPVPVEIPVEPGNLPWDGDGLAKGLGMVGIYFRNSGLEADRTLGASASLAVAFDETTAQLSTSPPLAYAGIHPEEFHTLWVTAVADPTMANAYDIDLYINGSTTPIPLRQVALQVPEPGVPANDVGFGAGVTNFLAIGCPNTGPDASVEIDHIAWRKGVHPPRADTCGGPVKFKRGDADGNGTVELTDVINILGFLFLGNPRKLPCWDASDGDDSGVLDVTDAIVSLGWQFLGKPRDLASPGALSCGPDQDLGDMFPPCNSTCR
jgi:hypothetical protein